MLCDCNGIEICEDKAATKTVFIPRREKIENVQQVINLFVQFL